MAKRITYVFGADLSDLERSWRKIEKNMQRLSRQMKQYGAAMSKAFTVPFTAIGAAASKAALDVEKALATIARGTGAQGKDLEALQATWRELAGNVSQSFDVSAQVLADYNTRLGVTGKALSDLSKKALDAARMLGEDVTQVVAQSSKAMQDWGVDAKDMARTLDMLFAASQQTGISMAKLGEELYKYGSPLRALGFDMETAVATLANFEKAGVNVELVLGALRQGLAKMAREGITEADKAFAELVDRIRNAETDTEATRLAIEVFGSRAGPDMAMAIREGRFAVDQLAESLKQAGGVIDETSRKTETLADQWARTKNKILLALEPIGKQIVKVAESALPKLEAAVAKVSEKIGSMSEETQQKILLVAGVLAAGGPLVIAIGASVNALTSLAGAFLALVSGPAATFILTAVAIAAAIYGVVKALKDLVNMQEKVTGMTAEMAKLRGQYMVQAGEIFNQKYGRYPGPTVEDQEKLKAILDELVSKQEEVKQKNTEVANTAKENFKEVFSQLKEDIDSLANGVYPAAVDNIVDNTERWKEKLVEVKRKYDEIIDAIAIVQAEQAYATAYEGAPIPTSTWKEREWSRSDIEEARRIGQQVAATLDSAKQKTGDLGRFFDDLVTKADMWTKSLTDGIADAIVSGRSLSSVLQEIAMQLARMTISKALTGIFGGFFSLFHEGGIVGAPGPKTFRRIKRYHTGGIVGADEELAILRHGEAVFTPAQLDALGSAIGGGEQNVKSAIGGGEQNVNITMNVNAIDARSVVEFFRGNKGMIESLVVESIRRDGTLRKVIKGLV